MAEKITNLIKGGSDSKIKSMHVSLNNGILTTDGLGDAELSNITANMTPFFYVADSGTLDAFYTVFRSTSNNKWYVHLSNFADGRPVTGSNLAGTVYYME